MVRDLSRFLKVRLMLRAVCNPSYRLALSFANHDDWVHPPNAKRFLCTVRPNYRDAVDAPAVPVKIEERCPRADNFRHEVLAQGTDVVDEGQAHVCRDVAEPRRFPVPLRRWDRSRPAAGPGHGKEWKNDAQDCDTLQHGTSVSDSECRYLRYWKTFGNVNRRPIARADVWGGLWTRGTR